MKGYWYWEGIFGWYFLFCNVYEVLVVIVEVELISYFFFLFLAGMVRAGLLLGLILGVVIEKKKNVLL